MARRYAVARVYRIPGDAAKEPLKVALVLSGPAPNWCFFAGVAHELLSAMSSGLPMLVDVVAGTSAGAPVAAMVAKSLTTGAPFGPMLSSWADLTLDRLARSRKPALPGASREQEANFALFSSGEVARLLEHHVATNSGQHSFQPARAAPRVVLAFPLAKVTGPPAAAELSGVPDEAVRFRFSLPDQQRLYRTPIPAAVWRRVVRATLPAAATPFLFSPEMLPWSERVTIPGLVEERWANDARLEAAHRLSPTTQQRLRYLGGAALGRCGVEQAVGAFPDVTGAKGESGFETLIYDPRRCVLVATPAGQGAPSQTEQFELARQTEGNHKHERIMLFLADTAKRLKDGRGVPELAELLRQFSAEGERVGRPGPAAWPWKQAVDAFYQWLADGTRFRQDMRWLDRRPANLRDLHRSIRPILGSLRDAYNGLRTLDPIRADQCQAILRELHLTLLDLLGVTGPWVALCQAAPDRPLGVSQLLSREGLRFQFGDGRHAAFRWMKQHLSAGLSLPEPEAVGQPPAGLAPLVLVRSLGTIGHLVRRLYSEGVRTAELPYGLLGKLALRLSVAAALLVLVQGIFLATSVAFGWFGFAGTTGHVVRWIVLVSAVGPFLFGAMALLTLWGLQQALEQKKRGN